MRPSPGRSAQKAMSQLELANLRKDIDKTSEEESDVLHRLENGLQALSYKVDMEFRLLHKVLMEQAKRQESGNMHRSLHTTVCATPADVGDGGGEEGECDSGSEEYEDALDDYSSESYLRPARETDPAPCSSFKEYDGRVNVTKHKSETGDQRLPAFLQRWSSLNAIKADRKCGVECGVVEGGVGKEDASASMQHRSAGLNAAGEDISHLSGVQNSVFAQNSKGSPLHIDFSFRKNIRQALQSSRRSNAGLRKKTKRTSSGGLLWNQSNFQAVSTSDAHEKAGFPNMSAWGSASGSHQGESSGFYDQHQPEQSTVLQSDKSLLAFAALDFKLASNSKAKKKKKKPSSWVLGLSSGLRVPQPALSGEVASGMPPLSTPPQKQLQHRTNPGPIGEGREFVSLPNILTSGMPCQEEVHSMFNAGDMDNHEGILALPTTLQSQAEVPLSDSSYSVTETEEGDEHCPVFLWLDWIWAVFFSILHPTGFFRTKWDFYMLLLFAYVCIVAPYIICFGVEFSRNSALGVIEIMVDASFIVDIYLNFRTASFDDTNKLIIKHKDIAFIYLRTWLPVDLVSVIPFDQLVVNEQLGFVKLFKATRVVKLVKILRLLKIVKMLRLFKIPTLLRHLESAFGRGLLRLVSFMSAAILVTHLVACFFYYSAYLEGYHKDTWVTIGQLQNASNFDKYVTALYWSMSTLTTVGYGDVTPGNANEKIMSMVGMVVGVTVFAYFMGSMSAMMSSINSSNTRITRKLLAVEDFLRQRKVPPNLAERVRTFFNYILSRQIIVEETSIINELSLPLRTEIVLYLYREALERLPFFQGKDPQFIVHIVTSLKLEYYAPGEVVIRQGDPGNMMYFVGNGILEVRLYYEGGEAGNVPAEGGTMKASEVPPTHQNTKVANETYSNTIDLVNAWRNVSMFGPSESYQKLGTLYAGEYFGEYSCLLGECRTATVVAQEYCELYSLSRADLDEILEDLPELGRVFLKMVEGYVEAGFGKNLVNKRLQTRMDTPPRRPVATPERHPRRASIVDKIFKNPGQKCPGSIVRPDPSKAPSFQKGSCFDPGHRGI